MGLTRVTETKPYLRAKVSGVSEEAQEVDRVEIDALMRNIKTNFKQVVSLSPLLSDDLQTLAVNISEPGRLADFIASSLTTIETPVRQEVLETLDVRARMDTLEPRAHQGARGARARLEDPVAGAVGGRQEPARVLPARAAQGDPEGARRGRRPDQGRRRAEGKARSGRPAGSRDERGDARARSPVEDAGGGGRIHRVAHLSRLDRDAAVAEAVGRDDRPCAHQAGARRRALGPREGQGPHSRVPGRAQAEPGAEEPDPVLCRPARRRQDVAGPLHRPVARPQVRARVARRHARRGRDPRPPPHLHRRAARPDHPGPAPRRDAQPGVHPRRDRQAGERLPRRPGVGAARGARPGAEHDVPRSLPRRAVRSVGGALHHHRQRARPDSAGAARPHGSAGDSRATPRKRSWRSPATTWRPSRSRTTA